MNKQIHRIHTAMTNNHVKWASDQERRDIIQAKEHFDLEWECGGYGVQEEPRSTGKPKLSLTSASILGGCVFACYSLKPLSAPLTMTLDEACALIDARNAELFTSIEPIEITEEQFWEALEVLPPQRWKGGVFYCMEALTGSIHAMYCEAGGKYFTANRCIIETSNAAFKAECVNLGS